VASGRDPRPILERVARLSFAASALALPAFLVAIPGVITTVFGSQWSDAALIFPGVIASLFIGHSVAAPCIHFLYAVGRPSDVFRMTVIAVVVNLVCIALLLWTIGVWGIGLGTVPGAIIESVVLGNIVHKLTGAKLYASMPSALFASLLAVGGGLFVILTIDQDGVAAVLGAATAFAISAVVCVLMERAVVVDLLTLARRSVSAAVAGG
jgi:O-antigen/teichoic acid export membrane protein